MSKQTKSRARTKPKISAVEREEQRVERILKRNVARQRRVRALSRALIAATAVADRELRQFAQFIRERDGDAEAGEPRDAAVNE